MTCCRAIGAFLLVGGSIFATVNLYTITSMALAIGNCGECIPHF